MFQSKMLGFEVQPVWRASDAGFGDYSDCLFLRTLHTIVFE